MTMPAPPLDDEEFTAVRSHRRSLHDEAPTTRYDGEPTRQYLTIARPPKPPEVHVEARETSHWTPPETRVAYEVLTRNCAYRLNCRLDCVEVVDLWTGRAIASHPLLGAWLAGGRAHGEEGDVYSYPLPAQGSKAVFQLADPGGLRMAVTSTVERVQLINTHYRPPSTQPSPGGRHAAPLPLRAVR